MENIHHIKSIVLFLICHDLSCFPVGDWGFPGHIPESNGTKTIKGFEDGENREIIFL